MSITAALDAGLGSVAAAAVAGYQRYLSPWKGFACAHRVAHGGDSCSAHVRRVAAAEGFLAALRALRPRLRACREAAHLLRDRRAALTLARDFDEEFDPPPGAASKAGDRKRQPDCHLSPCDASDCLLVVPDLACSDCALPELGACDLPLVDCGACW